MNTAELIEIARECGGRYAYTNWGYHPFTLTELQQLAQRIEQPHLQRIVELEQQVRELEKDLDIEREELQSLESDITCYENDEIKLNEKIKQLREALRDVENPVIKFRRELKQGERLNGIAVVSALKAPETYKKIARKALEETK